MKTRFQELTRTSTLVSGAVLLFIGLGFGCGRTENRQAQSEITNARPSSLGQAADPLKLVMVPHQGAGRVDEEIRITQGRLRASTGPRRAEMLERLGWLFVGKARASFDPGYYKLAEQCALALESREPEQSSAWLLRGHALHSQHRFHEARLLAEKLVSRRGLSFDFGLLGDVLVDAGNLNAAARAYQSMIDLKPEPLGYARVGHIRWLKGDLAGAVEALVMAARGATPRDPESAAWIHTQLARYLWQAQATNEARRSLELAFEFQKDYAPALLWHGRMLLANGNNDEAIRVLRDALRLNPLPEYYWVLSEGLRAEGREQEAREMEAALARQAASSDPRTYSLYLATRGEEPARAVRLAEQELQERSDIFTQDALAWALLADGRVAEAQDRMRRALAEGTQDARLFLHATVLAAAAGRMEDARSYLAKTTSLAALLLPSEAAKLRATARIIGEQAANAAAQNTPLQHSPSRSSARVEEGS